MKPFSVLIPLSMAFLCSCGSPQRAVTESAPRTELLQRLHNVQASGRTMFGHHDTPCYGHLWQYEPGRSDILETAGDYPAVFSWDLGRIELGDTANLDGVPFDYERRQIAHFDSLGAINVLSWHPRNPATGGDTWDVTGDALNRVTNPNDSLYIVFQDWLNAAANYIGSLRRTDGTRIPIVFRPWHEHTGKWFWWGEPNSSPEAIKTLWHMTREAFDTQGIDNVLWAYSPDVVADSAAYMRSYPGDQYIDIFGCDVYQWDVSGDDHGNGAYAAKVGTDLGIATQLAREQGKIAAFTETGLNRVSDPRWFPDVLLPLLKEYRPAYVCVWRNAMDKPEEYFAPYAGHPAAEPFKEFALDHATIFLKDLAEIH